jgi:Protein of unknown function (DUF1566)
MRIIFFFFLFASLLFPQGFTKAAPSSDTLIKASSAAVYYYASDGNRYAFPNSGTYFSWFTDFSNVQTVSDAELASIPLAGNVTYRPGIRLIKITTDPKVYAVSYGGKLHWLSTEALAIKHHGENWNQLIDDVADTFFVNYSIADPITESSSYDPYLWADQALTINEDMGIQQSQNALMSDTAVAKAVKSSSVVVDTNQSLCYDDNLQITCGSSHKGQDAEYMGTQSSYQDNNDGTVTDLNTGLMWQQDAGSKVTYPEAVAGAASFSLAGYDDWRLPSIKELYSLMDFSGSDISGDDNGTQYAEPFIDDDYFKFYYGDTSAGDRAIDSQWATSNVYESTVMNNEQCFFGVNFADGRIKCYPTTKGKGYFVIYVRGAEYGVNDYQNNGDGTVNDSSTGLIWQQSDSGYGMNWEEALSYCESLSTAGQINWRLPNAKELQSIVDYSRSPDTTNSPALDSVFDATSITNEAGQKDWAMYWSGTTHANTRTSAYAAYVAFGRAMGNMQGNWMDVHGAGAQRSDPKTGSSADYPTGHGPQGDAIRVDNYVRCVTD